MDESEFHARIYRRSSDLTRLDPRILVGPGDDAAVVRTGSGDRLVLTTDQLIEGRHYEPGTDPARIAHKAAARSVSDAAAMGARPRWMLATAALRTGAHNADALFDALAERARHWHCPLVGGDISATDGPTVLTTTVIGEIDGPRAPVLRSEARPEHGVFVTGRLGGSLLAGRHLSFEPRTREALWLCRTLGDRLGAMIDLSDGLGRDGMRIASASGVCVELDASELPIHRDVTPGIDAWRAAISDGEDYELLFTAAGEVPDRAPGDGTPITRIGRVMSADGAGPSCTVRTPSGASVDASSMGWEHRI